MTIEVQPPGRLTRRSQAGDVVLAYLSTQSGRLRALDLAVRRDAPDAIHQMRVTTRRLRAALQAFPMVVLEPTTQLKGELRWLGQVLGDARDADVLEQYFEDRLIAAPVELVIGPAQARVVAHFAPAHAAARDAVLAALDSARYFGILHELDRLLAEPLRTEAATGPAAEVLHEARKAAKRARYAAEAVEPVFGKQARRFAKRMKAVQSVLGDQHDVVIAAGVAREIGVQAHLAGENAFSFGLLNERAHRDALEYQRQARKVWQRAAGHKARRWLSDSH
jgi:CHAD domain-containing protein